MKFRHLRCKYPYSYIVKYYNNHPLSLINCFSSSLSHISHFINISIYLSIHIYLSRSKHNSIYLVFLWHSFRFSVCLSVCLYMCVCVCVCVWPHRFHVSQVIHKCLSICILCFILCIYFNRFVSIYLSIYHIYPTPPVGQDMTNFFSGV